MNMDLAPFWTELEANFPLGGPRLRLRELLGDELEGALEHAGVLVYWRVADQIVCPQWSGRGCPRTVFRRRDGSIVAMCGNRPLQCRSLELTPEDIEVLTVSPEQLAAAIGKALQIRVHVEPLAIRGAYRVGTFVPEVGVTHAIYFLARRERDYGEAVDALRTHAAGQTFAILVPTVRFIPEAVRRHTKDAGILLVSLEDCVGLAAEGRLHALVEPLKLFDRVGRVPSDTAADTAPAPIVARALVRERDRAPRWHDLDAAAYERLAAGALRYDVFADELTKTVVKNARSNANVQAWQFKMIRAALEERADYDPGTGDNDGVAAKQMFQRARKTFDLRSSDGWHIFPSAIVDSHAVYRFAPIASVTFVFVFAASADTQD
ncbi:MAG: hypothetical protein ABIY55_05370 [Kofleriaceae bacterium]